MANTDTMPSIGAFTAGDLFQLLRDGKPRSRRELSAITGLARSTIALRMDELIMAGLVQPVREPTTMPGRPPVRVALNPTARVVVAGDIGAMHSTAGITDLRGATLISEEFESSVSDGPATVLGQFAEVADRLLQETERGAHEVAAVGIGVPVPVIHETGQTVNPTNLPEWQNFDVAEYVSERFGGAPTLVDNDANIMALGERAITQNKTDDLVFVKASTGIGSGIVSGGVLQRGAKGTAGAIGHIAVAQGAGVPCICGNTGCLVALAGAPAIAATLSEGRDVPPRTVDDIVELVSTGDIDAIRAVRQAGRHIGEVLTTCISIVNPDVIVIGGRLAEAGDHLIAGVREVVYQRAMPFATESLTVTASQSRRDGGLVGASLLALEHALSARSLQNLTRTTAS